MLRPDIFRETTSVNAGFSTRAGGVSTRPFATLNLGFHVGDDAAHVQENRRRFCRALRVDPARLATADQVHGANVQRVTTARHVPACDGLVTARPGLALAIGVADCAAVLLADAAAGVVAVLHVGWRGAVAGIVAEGVAAMQAEGAAPERLRAYVSPCIGPDSFEVGPEVAAQFDDTFVVAPDEASDPDRTRPHVNLKAAIRGRLAAAGVSADAIEVSPHDTMAEPDTFFSYRAAGGTTGRMLGLVSLAP